MFVNLLATQQTQHIYKVNTEKKKKRKVALSQVGIYV